MFRGNRSAAREGCAHSRCTKYPPRAIGLDAKAESVHAKRIDTRPSAWTRYPSTPLYSERQRRRIPFNRYNEVFPILIACLRKHRDQLIRLSVCRREMSMIGYLRFLLNAVRIRRQCCPMKPGWSSDPSTARSHARHPFHATDSRLASGGRRHRERDPAPSSVPISVHLPQRDRDLPEGDARDPFDAGCAQIPVEPGCGGRVRKLESSSPGGLGLADVLWRDDRSPSASRSDSSNPSSERLRVPSQ